MAAAKKRKRYVKRAPLAKIAGIVLGATLASGGSSGPGGTRLSAAILEAASGNTDRAMAHFEDIVTNPPSGRNVVMGIGIAMIGSEISKMNSKWIGLKANLPLGVKVRL